jgi:biotin carboxyl carrier protein
VVVAGGHALYRGFAYRLADDDEPAAAVPLAGGSLAAPMPGRVLRVNVEEGDEVDQGEVVVLLEAMKMELAVSAPAPGTVRVVHVAAGDLVAGGQTLVEVES